LQREYEHGVNARKFQRYRVLGMDPVDLRKENEKYNVDKKPE